MCTIYEMDELHNFNTFNISTSIDYSPVNLFKFSTSSVQKKKVLDYGDSKGLFEGLKREESDAIRVLYSKISDSVFSLGNKYRLPPEDIEEMICDCITLIIQKIREGAYVFQGYDPATYVIEIAKNKVKSYSQKLLKHSSTLLDETTDIVDEPNITDYAATEVLTGLLKRLSENCQKLIQFKYLDERRDKEIIELKLTQYTTIDSLKSHRAQCMKKLSELAASALS
ncbi:MAG: hypothetical protein ABI761_17715 [Saprospiraceae bacterium]